MPAAKFFGLLLSTWFSFSLIGYTPSAIADITDILPRIKASVAGVGTLHPLRSPRIKLLGTGFVVADGLHVITNAHVAPVLMEEDKGESMAVFLRGADGIIVRKATAEASDPEHDLLLLKIEGDAVPAMKLGDSNQVREGQQFYFTGFPIGAALGLYPATHHAGLAAIAPIFSPPTSTQRLTAKLIRRADNPFLMFQLDAIAYPGNSGSPLYDGNTGAVIGVINSVFVKGAKENALRDPSGITYAIPARYIQALLDKTGIETSATPALRGKR
jgi:S1-C subfamily serine protease